MTVAQRATVTACLLQALDVRCLGALRPLGDLEAHPLVLLEAPVSTRRDGREVREHVRATVIRSDEAKTFFRVEPLNGTLRHAFSFERTHRAHTA